MKNKRGPLQNIKEGYEFISLVIIGLKALFAATVGAIYIGRFWCDYFNAEYLLVITLYAISFSITFISILGIFVAPKHSKKELISYNILAAMFGIFCAVIGGELAYKGGDIAKGALLQTQMYYSALAILMAVVLTSFIRTSKLNRDIRFVLTFGIGLAMGMPFFYIYNNPAPALLAIVLAFFVGLIFNE
ncbi:hypothetical protein [Candidatus Uabimicrobium amorphum]|uniref:Uncharacterized protein n=1 Tax=Uabimicrobium amorphum TaxID=2596890 RepID=A0A5S9F2L6_UABAM|nr:hypothetical protein [Candidatus Uabimicrobium amorphum]BBM82504.1 hypothetical protein UABAM_00847 [Candidatus Uabimicrobium amorphum]